MSRESDMTTGGIFGARIGVPRARIGVPRAWLGAAWRAALLRALAAPSVGRYTGHSFGPRHPAEAG
jgi:hypothetical protein